MADGLPGQTVQTVCDITAAAHLPLQQAVADISHAAADTDLYCPLSGEVMRDPVLYGGGGHSFEREVLEEWVAANPGVHPLSQQPLPPGTSAVLPNHALRNIIQLRLSQRINKT